MGRANANDLPPKKYERTKDMSYNITTWKTKEINNLLIPFEVIEKLPYTDIEIDWADKDNKSEGLIVKADGLSEGFELVGKTLAKDMVEVIKLYNSGDSSGSTWDDFIKMLEKSSGKLVALQIWEGGDTITKLTVNDGEVIKELVEL